MGGARRARGVTAWPLAAGAVLLSACGGGNAPLASSSTSGLRTVQLVSGDDGSAVGGATVRIGTRTATSDAQGRLTLDPWDGEAVDIQAAGFLPRETSLGQQARFTLWPVPSYPEEYVRSLLYITAARVSSAGQPLRRVVAASITIVPSEALLRDAQALSIHRQAAAQATEATGGLVRFQIESSARGEVVFTSGIEGGGPEGALTYRNLKGDTIVGGRITFSDLRYARDLRFVTHELGHALGLQHSLDGADMMHFSCGVGCAEAFSDRERVTIRLLLQRPPGNSYPDRDRGLAAASPAGADVVVD
jgi:hypothetical protein